MGLDGSYLEDGSTPANHPSKPRVARCAKEAECADVRSLIVREDSKCIAWQWRNWADLTENLYLPLRLFKKTGYQPFFSGQQQAYVSF
jgi:hypothetical protein